MSSKRKVGIQLLKQGYSYSQIKSKLKVAKSTINNWFSQLSQEEKTKIKTFRVENWRKSTKGYRARKRRQTLKEEKAIQEKAAKKIGPLSKKELFLIGTALYWAEGSKTNRWQLQFSNSDADMIRMVLSFFQKICKIANDQFYLQLILHKNVDEEKALGYWSRITKLPKNQFKKASYSLSNRSKGKRRKNKLPFGTLQVRILDKKITHEVYGYIRGLKKAKVV